MDDIWQMTPQADIQLFCTQHVFKAPKCDPLLSTSTFSNGFVGCKNCQEWQ